MKSQLSGSHRVTEQRAFGPTLEWGGLPVLGAQPRKPHWPVALVWLGVIALASLVPALLWIALAR
jgi:hypothetical protein